MKSPAAKPLSIRGKLYMLSGTAAAVALILASVVFSFQQFSTYRENTFNRLESVGQLLAANTIAAITFDDRVSATEVLGSLEQNNGITAACIFANDGTQFATYWGDGVEDLATFPAVKKPGRYFDDDGDLELFVKISDGDEAHGTLYLKSNTDQLYADLYRYAILVAFVFVAALGAALFFSSWMQRTIAVPIKELAGTAERISVNHDYSIRVHKSANDEIGVLFDAFNDMLEQIESSEKELIEARNDLEDRVKERTSQLTESNLQLTSEMEERQKVQSRLVQASRQAGMAEVATGVLHNVGNVLNSVNVSANLISRIVQGSKVASVVKLANLIKENEDSLADFVVSERGVLLPKMLSRLSEVLTDEQTRISDEVDSLQINIDHIKTIVAAQQAYGKVSGVTETLNVSDLLSDSANIGKGSLGQRDIEFVKDFEEMPEINSDRHQLLQIFVNLIRNAGQAIESSQTENGEITLRTKSLDDGFVVVQVRDNGIGIDAESLDQIFTHGFTTKENGHGFGLHSAALAAKKLGGSLAVDSPGLGFGAEFTLRLPGPAAVLN